MPTERKLDESVHFEFSSKELGELNIQIRKSIEENKLLDLLDKTHEGLFSTSIQEEYINYFLEMYFRQMKPEIEKSLRSSEAAYYTIRKMNEDYFIERWLKSKNPAKHTKSVKRPASLESAAEESVTKGKMIEFLEDIHYGLFKNKLKDDYINHLLNRWSFYIKKEYSDAESKKKALVETLKKMGEDHDRQSKDGKEYILRKRR